MKYSAIYTKEEYVDRMADLAKTKVAKIPILDTNPKTEYWISDDGKSVFVAHEICERMFINTLTIKTKKRSLNSEPYIKYRTIRNTQITITVSRAVYGAFFLKTSLPKLKPYHKDGNMLNNAFSNFETTEIDDRFRQNVKKHAGDYAKYYDSLTRFCQATTGKDYQTVKDIVSDAFIYTCERRYAIRSFVSVWSLFIQKLSRFHTYSKYHESLEFLEIKNPRHIES